MRFSLMIGNISWIVLFYAYKKNINNGKVDLNLNKQFDDFDHNNI